MISLTREEFETSIKSFIKQSEKINEQWILINTPMLNYKYLQQTSHIVIIPSENNYKLLSASENYLSETNVGSSVYEEDIACAKIDQNENNFILMMNYHVLYSPTYQVPVLYFNAQYADGSILSLDELYEYVIPEIYQNDLKSSPINIYGSISQAEHPLTGVPFWYIHPCQTQNMLQSIVSAGGPTSDDYIKVWLSLVGPIVKYHITLELFL